MRLGLPRRQTMRLVVIPQAMRVIIPPLTSHYLNLTKNSSLAVGIGYPDLFAIFAGTALNQSGAQAIEIMAITMATYLALSLATSASDEFLQCAAAPGGALSMSDMRHRFCATETAAAVAATRARAGDGISLRRWEDFVLTALSLYLIWLIGWPALKFLLIDAVWTGSSRTDCLAETVGHPVGACWPFITAKFSQFVYGFYPESERWRANLTFLLGAGLLLPLLDPASAVQDRQRRRVLRCLSRRRLFSPGRRRLRPALCGDAVLGRAAGDPGGSGHRHRGLAAARHIAGAGAALRNCRCCARAR